MPDAKLATLAFATSVAAVAVYRWVLNFSLYTRTGSMTFALWAMGLIMISLGLAVTSFIQGRGKLRWVSAISILLVVSQFLPWFEVDSSKLMADQCIALWKKNRAEYETVALATTKEGELDAKMKHLSMDGKVHVEDKDGTRIITFLQYEWGLDNSFAFVYLAQAEPPKSSAAQEQWWKAEELAPGWYLVEGT